MYTQSSTQSVNEIVQKSVQPAEYSLGSTFPPPTNLSRTNIRQKFPSRSSGTVSGHFSPSVQGNNQVATPREDNTEQRDGFRLPPVMRPSSAQYSPSTGPVYNNGQSHGRNTSIQRNRSNVYMGENNQPRTQMNEGRKGHTRNNFINRKEGTKGDRKNESIEIASLTLNTHGIDQHEHALLLYTFGEPEKEASPSFVAVKYTVIAVVLAGLIWNPWVDKLIEKYLKNVILRFTAKIVVFLILFFILSRIIS